MHQFTNIEMTDMLLAYGKMDCNGRAAQRLYVERFPDRHAPHHSTFASIERRLREGGEFKVDTAAVIFMCASLLLSVTMFAFVSIVGEKTGYGATTIC